ncbi:putative sugar nucleotidyl transferase [Candidatus Margulisiibacteriota bacterium]
MYNLCIFEDTKYRNFLPLTYMRPVYDLSCGLDSLLGKIIRYVPHENVILHCRPYLKDILKQKHINAMINQFTTAGATLFINGRCLADPGLVQGLVFKENKNYVYLNQQEEVVMAYLCGDSLEVMKKLLTKGPLNCAEVIQAFRLKSTVKKLNVSMAGYPWELLSNFHSKIVEDFRFTAGGVLKGNIHKSAYLINEENIFINNGSKIDAFSVLDASEGPIYISNNVHVHPHSQLKGPLYIGDNSQILGAKVSSSSVGPFCKIGGEVVSSIILGYTNKAHAGFLGHSYLGEWINLGAMTTNSNLKNNYKPVKVMIDGSLVQTKETFFGCIIGDHTKTGIGTMLNTGLVIGVANNLFGSSLFTQQTIPSYVWGTPSNLTEHFPGKAMLTAQAAMARRSLELTDADQEVLKTIYQLTANERFHFLKANC